MTLHLRSLIALVLFIAVQVAPAQAADSHAPRHARADWLPQSEWVMSGWLPYDQARLERLLRTDQDALETWLDDKRTLGELARRAGWPSTERLARALLAPRLHGASRRTRRVLLRRARDTLTQAHLARHVLFHIFHTPAIAEDARRVFGVSPASFRRLRDGGASPVRIAGDRGRTPEQLVSALDALFVRRARRAVRTRSTTAAQAAALLARQRALLPVFIHRRYRTPAEQAQFVCDLPA